MHRRGFSLVEILIVITILIVIVAMVFVFIDPATRLAQTRNVARSHHLEQIADALLLLKQDDADAFYDRMEALDEGSSYILTRGTGGCTLTCAAISANPAVGCFTIEDITVSEYLKAFPADPLVTDQNGSTKYYLRYQSDELLLGACEPETIDGQLPIIQIIR